MLLFTFNFLPIRSELNSMKSDLKTSYEAKRVTVDSCNEISWSTEWVWISVGLGECVTRKNLLRNLEKYFISWWCRAALVDNHGFEKN